jgi:hypothetical protein
MAAIAKMINKKDFANRDIPFKAPFYPILSTLIITGEIEKRLVLNVIIIDFSIVKSNSFCYNPMDSATIHL